MDSNLLIGSFCIINLRLNLLKNITVGEKIREILKRHFSAREILEINIALFNRLALLKILTFTEIG